MIIIVVLTALALAGLDSSSYAQSKCETEEDIKRINGWSPEDELGRYVGDEALLFLEIIQEEMLGSLDESVLDYVVVWTLPAKNVPFLVAFAFKGGCTFGHRIFDKGALGHVAGVIEQFRNSTGGDIHDFLPPTKRLYYSAERYHTKGRFAEAEPLYKQVLETWKKSIGSYAFSVNRTIDKLGLLYEDQGNYEEAGKFYEKAMSNWSSSLGGGTPEEAKSRANYIRMLRKTGREDWAAELEARAKAIRELFSK